MKQSTVPENLDINGHLVRAILYRQLAEKDRPEYWRSRARWHELKACQLAGQPVPPAGYDQAGGLQNYDDWKAAGCPVAQPAGDGWKNYFSWTGLEFYQTSEPEPPVVEKKSAEYWIASNLLKQIARDDSYDRHRAAQIWLIWPDKADKCYMSQSEFISNFSNRLDLHPQTVKRILDNNDGIFWFVDRKRGQTYVRLAGKQHLYNYYELTWPGVSVRLPGRQVGGNLKQFRALFRLAVFNGRTTTNSVTRQQIRDETGLSKMSQIQAEKTLKIPKVFQDIIKPEGKEQGPNLYVSPSQSRRKKTSKIRWGEYAGTNPNRQPQAEGPGVTSRRRLAGFFDNAEQAKSAVRHRDLFNIPTGPVCYYDSRASGGRNTYVELSF